LGTEEADQAGWARIRPDHVETFARIAEQRAGIHIKGHKSEFLRSRLSKRLARRGVADFDAYCRLLQADEREQILFVEALTTHTTSFCREPLQYEWLREVGLPALYETGVGRLRPLTFWSAACSTGAEGYTALFVAEDLRQTKLFSLAHRLIGTDISRRVLHRAEVGVYPEDEVRGLPLEMRRRYVLRAKKGDGRCRIAPEIRRLATWRLANLTDAATLETIQADVVFLRNVLIYFDPQMQQRVIENVLRRLAPGGYLLTGHTETATTRRKGLTVLRPSIYRKDD
jgi:chemotaxis protein methyltransferase CheR